MAEPRLARSSRLATFGRPAAAGLLPLALVLAYSAPALPDMPEGVVWMDVIDPGGGAWDAQMDAAWASRGAGDIDGAIAHLQNALSLRPDRPEPAWSELDCLVGAGRWDRVIARADVHLAAFASESDAVPPLLFFRAIALTRVGRLSEARDDLERAVRFRDSLAQAEVYYGNLAELEMALGHGELAVLFYQQALAANPRYIHARAGLGVALERLGRSDEARRQFVAAILGQPDLGFLDAPGMFFVPDGEGFLMRALLLDAIGESAGASQALDRFAASLAGSSSDPDFLTRLRDRMSTPDQRVSRLSIPACNPLQMARRPGGGRLAVLCDSGSLREGRVRGRETELQDLSSPLLADGYGYYSVSDIAYADGGSALRILFNTNQLETLRFTGNGYRPEQTVNFGTTDLMAMSLFANGSRVLFSGSSSAGFQLADWNQSPVVPQITYFPSGMWLYRLLISSDERTVLTWDGSAISSWSLPGLVRLSSMSFVDMSGSGAAISMSPDGSRIVTSNSTGLVITDSATMQADRIIRLGDGLEPPAETSLLGTQALGIATIEWTEPDVILAGRYGEIWVVELH